MISDKAKALGYRIMGDAGGYYLEPSAFLSVRLANRWFDTPEEAARALDRYISRNHITPAVVGKGKQA